MSPMPTPATAGEVMLSLAPLSSPAASPGSGWDICCLFAICLLVFNLFAIYLLFTLCYLFICFSQGLTSPVVEESNLTPDGSVCHFHSWQGEFLFWDFTFHKICRLSGSHLNCLWALCGEVGIAVQFLRGLLDTCPSLGWISLWTQQERKRPQAEPGEAEIGK